MVSGHGEVPADGGRVAEKGVGQGLIDQRDVRGVVVVMPGEVASGDEPRPRGLQKARRDVDVVRGGDAVGTAEILGAFAVDGGGASAGTQRGLVDGADGGDAGNLRGLLDHALLDRQ
jgi:hypothetical protein